FEGDVRGGGIGGLEEFAEERDDGLAVVQELLREGAVVSVADFDEAVERIGVAFTVFGDEGGGGGARFGGPVQQRFFEGEHLGVGDGVCLADCLCFANGIKLRLRFPALPDGKRRHRQDYS